MFEKGSYLICVFKLQELRRRLNWTGKYLPLYIQSTTNTNDLVTFR